ncbi:MAG: hypothetical protein M9894_00510 [Planctomycetes bacterium]|nr:hypothetical protein [Planctomycetota bacterium]
MHAPVVASRPVRDQSPPMGPLFSPFTHDLPTLGDVVWWTIPAEVEVSLAELEAKLEAAGLPTDLVPKLQARGALSTALKALETEDLIRRVVDDPAKIVYALVDEKVDTTDLALSYEQTETVIYDKQNKTLGFEQGRHADKIRALFDRYRLTAQAQHLRQIARQALEKANPVTVRPGLIFVPKQHRATLLAVGQFVSSLDGRAVLGALGIVDSKETRASMLRVVREELEVEIEKASGELDELLASDGARRASTLAARLESFRAIRAKVAGYAELLELASQDLLGRLAGLEQKVMTAL